MVQKTNPSRTVILVLGMHRSGTSAMTRILNLMGAALPKNVYGADQGNATGHWEPIRLIELHQRLLADFASCWYDWRPMVNIARQHPGKYRYYRSEIRHLIEEEYGEAPLFVLKEPRISRFLPLYLGIFAELKIVPCMVVMLRHPFEVADSLFQRDRIPTSQACLLWLRYMLEVESQTRGLRCTIMAYDRLLKDWRQALLQLTQQLRIQWPVTVTKATERIAPFLSPHHRHHQYSQAMLREDSLAQVWIGEAYAALRRLGRRVKVAQSQAILDRIYEQFTTVSPLLERLQNDCWRICNTRVAELETTLVNAKQDIKIWHLPSTLGDRGESES